MRSLVARVRRWWRLGGSSATVTPFEVACACGQVQRGLRQSRHQVLRCACGRDVFVLGRSPLPPPPPRGASVSGLRGPGRREGPGLRDRVTPPAAGWWRWPLLAAALTLAAVVALYAVLFGLLPPRPPATVAETAGEVRQLVRAGEAALAGGNFRLAEEKLAAARALLEQRPGEMTAHERRQVVNLHRQAALLADLLSESLGEILQHASALPAILYFLSGEASLHLGGEEKDARAGTWVDMPPRMPHSVLANTPVTMLLLLIKKDEQGSAQG